MIDGIYLLVVIAMFGLCALFVSVIRPGKL
jgi:hypothetical protein